MAETPKNNANIGMMVNRGPYAGTTTFSGYTLDQIKSALQKYIRRGMATKAVICAIEMFRLGELDKCKGFVTNLYNRLAIISAEDIGPANISLVGLTLDIVLSKNRDPSTLAALVQLQSDSLKTRIMSHLHRAYIDPQGITYARSLNFLTDDSYKPGDKEFIELNRDSFFSPGDPDVLIPIAMVLYRRLLDSDMMATSWLNYYLIVSKDKHIIPRSSTDSVIISKGGIKSLKKNRSDPSFILWTIFGRIIDRELNKKLSNAYYSLTENTPFLMTGFTSALYKPKYFDMSDSIESLIKLWKNNTSLDNLINGRYIFKISVEEKRYIFDMHTKIGKEMGMTRDKFVTEGALVIPECTMYRYDILHKIYKGF